MNLEGAADTRSRLAEILDRDETATTTQQRWWQRPRTLVTLALAFVLITTVVASRAFGSSAGSYRSVVVTTRAVDSTTFLTPKPVACSRWRVPQVVWR